MRPPGWRLVRAVERAPTKFAVALFLAGPFLVLFLDAYPWVVAGLLVFAAGVAVGAAWGAWDWRAEEEERRRRADGET